jgi:hypothetical protein
MRDGGKIIRVSDNTKVGKDIRTVIVETKCNDDVTIVLPKAKYLHDDDYSKKCDDVEKNKGSIVTVTNPSKNHIVIKAREGNNIDGCEGYFSLKPYDQVTFQNFKRTWYVIAT